VIGANGSGKSNFIGVFAFLHEIREGRLRRYVVEARGAEKVLHFGSKQTKEIYIDLSFANGVNRYELELGPTADDGLYPFDEYAHLNARVSNIDRDHTSFLSAVNGREAGISNRDVIDVAKMVQDHLGSWRVYHLEETRPMRMTVEVDNNRFLHRDGANLSAFLYYLREKHPASYDLIVRTVQQVAPFFDDFRLDPLQLKPDDIKLEWRHKRSDQYFGDSSLSDGTLRFIALATLFLQPEKHRPSVIFVDEPELGLHPYAIEMLAALIRQASITTQVILATQSPLLLDHFKPEDVLVADRVGGGTHITHLESSKLAKWLEDYSLGQLWEKNEFGGQPVPD
jgi:predicted ATPase